MSAAEKAARLERADKLKKRQYSIRVLPTPELSPALTRHIRRVYLNPKLIIARGLGTKSKVIILKADPAHDPDREHPISVEDRIDQLRLEDGDRSNVSLGV
jgi:hypothetical protein